MLAQWVENDLKKRFEGRIIDVNENIATTWGDLQGRLETVGKKISVIDGLIAASAIVEDMTVVTRNIKDIEQSGCNIVNPWE
jgi:toxin FitB